jgi:anaerobic selenocysteine-containing dehydrogenase
VDIHGDDDHPVSRGRLCARGKAFVQGLDHPDRITAPAFRKNLQAPFEPLEDWEKALDWYAEQLRKIKDHHGAESIVIGCDPEVDLDFALGAARFAGLLGTPHVYSPSDFPQSRSGISWPPYPVSPCYEWGNSRCLFLIEADLATTHPVTFGWALEAQQQGAKIIVADTRFTRTMSKADLALRILPQTGNVLGLALMKMILEKSGDDDDIGKARFTDYERWRASFEKLSWEDIKNTIGLTSQSVKELSDLLQRNGPITIVTGKNLSGLATYGIWSTLITAMGGYGTKGSEWYPLEATMPPLYPDREIADRNTEKVSQVKGTQAYSALPEPRAMFKKGRISAKTVLCSGDGLEDVFPFHKDQANELELIAYFGSFPNPSLERAHIIFPSTLWAEKSDLCFSNDRVVHWTEKIVEPKAGCKSGLDFWLGLAKRFGWQDAFPWIKEDGSADHHSFYHWILESSPEIKISGCKPDQLKGSNQAPNLCFWSYKNEIEEDEKIEPTPSPEAIEPDTQVTDRECFPLYFQKAPLVSVSGQVGNSWPWTQNLEEEDAVQINPQTAKVLTIENGDPILISSPGGTFEGRAWISRMVPKWMVASPTSSGGDWVMVQKKDQARDEALTILKEFLL